MQAVKQPVCAEVVQGRAWDDVARGGERRISGVLTRVGLGLAAIMVAIAGTPDVLAQSAPSGDEASSSVSSAAKPLAVADLVSRVVGEWEGSVQARREAKDGRTASSASVAGISARSVSAGEASAVVVGAAFGAPLDGALSWDARAGTASWCFGSDAPVRAASVASSDGTSIVFRAPADAAGVFVEQVVRLENESRVQVELVRVTPSKDAQGNPGAPTRETLLRFDVARLAPGETSLAASNYDASPQRVALAGSGSSVAAASE
jgi:hypothetical protein